MHTCPSCQHKIKYLDFIKWLDKFTHPLKCRHCGAQLADPALVGVIFLLFVPLYFIADYLLTIFLRDHEVGFALKISLFIPVLLCGMLLESYLLLRLWPVSAKHRKQDGR